MRTLFVSRIVIFTFLLLLSSPNLTAQFITEANGSVSFLTDGLKKFEIRRSSNYNSSGLTFDIAESPGHHSPGTISGDVVIRRSWNTSGGNKLIITSSLPQSYNPSQATGILASFSQNGLWVHNNGNIRLGEYSTTAPNVKLVVQGAIHAREIKVDAQTADFVFESDYILRSLNDVETYIKRNKHLPDIPSAAKMKTDGVDLAEMNKLMLMKIEELTLYAIDKNKEVAELKKMAEKREEESIKLEERIAQIEALLMKQ